MLRMRAPCDISKIWSLLMNHSVFPTCWALGSSPFQLLLSVYLISSANCTDWDQLDNQTVYKRISVPIKCGREVCSGLIKTYSCRDLRKQGLGRHEATAKQTGTLCEWMIDRHANYLSTRIRRVIRPVPLAPLTIELLTGSHEWCGFFYSHRF